jgi:hypothetical protein
MSYIRHKIVLTLPRTDPTLFVEQGFAGRCESAGTVGQRVLHGGSSRQGTLGHGSHALRSIPPGTPFRFRLTPIGHSIRAPLPAPRLATSSAVSYGRVAVRPSEIIASFQIIPHASRSKRRIHGMTVTPLEHSCDANPSTNARNATWRRVRRFARGMAGMSSSTLCVTRIKWRFSLAFHALSRRVLNG